MSRDDGFQTADISTVMLDDAKVRKLARRCPDDGELAAAVVVYMATLLGSWREGRRLAATEAESWVEPTPERQAHLQAVGLLDADGRVPAPAWERHFKPAWERRENARAAGREGNRRRWGTDPAPIATPSVPDRLPIPTQSPTDRQKTDLPTGSQRSDRKAINGEEKPFVTLTDDEKAARRQKDRDELMARTMERLGVKP